MSADVDPRLAETGGEQARAAACTLCVAGELSLLLTRVARELCGSDVVDGGIRSGRLSVQRRCCMRREISSTQSTDQTPTASRRCSSRPSMAMARYNQLCLLSLCERDEGGRASGIAVQCAVLCESVRAREGERAAWGAGGGGVVAAVHRHARQQ
eukprot:2011898-Rhodomonas_salina.1